jgi:hypothetical protein
VRQYAAAMLPMTECVTAEMAQGMAVRGLVKCEREGQSINMTFKIYPNEPVLPGFGGSLDKNK